MIKLNNLTNKRGFSLLELLLVVAVGAILLLSGLAVYRNVTSGAGVNDAVRLLNVLKQETQRLYQGEGTYPNNQDLSETLIDAGVVPTTNIRGGDTIIHSAGDGNVVVTGSNNDFFIDFEGVEKPACMKIGSVYRGTDPEFVRLRIDGNNVPMNDGIITVATLSDRCAEGGSEMRWQFY